MRKNILITGEPKSGKSTFLEQVIADYPNKIGFVTREIRANDIRTGFELVSFDGRKTTLADVNVVSPYKIGKYYVQVENIDPFLATIPKANGTGLLYVDEIGQMQLFSEHFKEKVVEFLNSNITCIASITSVYEDNFTKAIKGRNDLIIIKIILENRDGKLEFVRMLLKKISKARRYASEPERFTFANNSRATLRSEHGIRKLTCTDNTWCCDCDFFDSYAICSHSIATEAMQDTIKLSI